MSFTPRINYLFYSMNEHHCRQEIVNAITEKSSDAIFFPWCPPDADITQLFYQPNSQISIDAFNEANETSPWIDLFKSVSGKTTTYIKFEAFLKNKKQKYIIIDAVHLLAHANSDPTKFYKELLAACNFHSFTNNIHFIISCARIPIVFHKENPLRHLWEFVDCTVPVEIPNINFKTSLDLLISKNTSSQSGDIYEKIKDRVDLKKGKSNPSTPGDIGKIDSEINDAIQGASESLSLFRSDVYMPDKRRPSLDSTSKQKIEDLCGVIVGQEEAVQRLIEKVLISRNPADEEEAAKDPKPLGIFLFVGPSGVGKTRISQKLAEVLPDYRFLQINLGEHQDRDSVNKLIGVGRGYVDSDQGGILTEPVRMHSKYVLLFDELDQAHNSVGQLFYKLFEGEVTDGRGRKVSFSDCYIIMTTNAGTCDKSSKRQTMAAAESSQKDEQTPSCDTAPIESITTDREEIERKLKATVSGSSKLKFTDAFLGRIYEIIHFNPLTLTDLTEIARRYFNTKIREPYQKVGITSFYFLLQDLGFEIDMHLVNKKILDAETLFFEIFAVSAGHENSQGARRLFQKMDEYLITPLELVRIRHPKGAKDSEFIFKFNNIIDSINDDFPNFEKPTLLIIDDIRTEVEELIELLKDKDIADVKWCDFDLKEEIVKSSQVVLLDLFFGETPINVDEYRDKIRKLNEHAPIILHSSLEYGPQRGKMQTEHWKTGTFGYLVKGENKEVIINLICQAIRVYHASYKSGLKIKNLEVIPPRNYVSNSLQFEFKYTYEQ